MGTSSSEIQLSAREHALVAGGGAGSLRVEAWEELLVHVCERGETLEQRWRRVILALQLSVGALVVSAAGHLVPVLAEAFRIVLFLAVFATIVLVGVALLYRGQRVPGRLRRLDLALVRELRRARGGQDLYLAINTDDAGIGGAFLSGALDLDSDEVMVFAIGGKSGAVTLEVGLGTRREPIGDELEPSVSGITRLRAEEEAREGNPFSTLEMVALKEAHRLQRRWAKLERFAAGDNPMPEIQHVLAEHVELIEVDISALTAKAHVMPALRAVCESVGRRL